MKIRCPKCNVLYRISSKKIPPQGARATCKNCGSRFEIPGGMVTAPVARSASSGELEMQGQPLPSQVMGSAQSVGLERASTQGMTPVNPPPAARQVPPVPPPPPQAVAPRPPSPPAPQASPRPVPPPPPPPPITPRPQPPPSYMPPPPPPAPPASPRLTPQPPAPYAPPPAPYAPPPPPYTPPPPPSAPYAPPSPPPPPPASPRPAPPMVQQTPPAAASVGQTPLRALSERLLIHRNNLANLRQQATDSGKHVPRFVTAGIDIELQHIRGLEEDIRRIAPPLKIRLKRLPEPGETDGQEKVFHRFPVILGRSAACDWQLDNSQISQIHVWLVQDGGQVLMEDLGSTNGGAIIRNGSLVHRFQPRAGLEQPREQTLAVLAKDLLYVATSRITIEEIGPDVSDPAR